MRLEGTFWPGIKKTFPSLGMKFRNFRGWRGGRDTRCIGTSEIQWAEARNTYLIDHARANHFRIGIDQYLTAQTRRPSAASSIYNIKGGQKRDSGSLRIIVHVS